MFSQATYSSKTCKRWSQEEITEFIQHKHDFVTRPFPLSLALIFPALIAMLEKPDDYIIGMLYEPLRILQKKMSCLTISDDVQAIYTARARIGRLKKEQLTSDEEKTCCEVITYNSASIHLLVNMMSPDTVRNISKQLRSRALTYCIPPDIYNIEIYAGFLTQIQNSTLRTELIRDTVHQFLSLSSSTDKSTYDSWCKCLQMLASFLSKQDLYKVLLKMGCLQGLTPAIIDFIAHAPLIHQWELFEYVFLNTFYFNRIDIVHVEAMFSCHQRTYRIRAEKEILAALPLPYHSGIPSLTCDYYCNPNLTLQNPTRLTP